MEQHTALRGQKPARAAHPACWRSPRCRGCPWRLSARTLECRPWPCRSWQAGQPRKWTPLPPIPHGCCVGCQKEGGGGEGEARGDAAASWNKRKRKKRRKRKLSKVSSSRSSRLIPQRLHVHASVFTTALETTPVSVCVTSKIGTTAMDFVSVTVVFSVLFSGSQDISGFRAFFTCVDFVLSLLLI